jgi:hypothetical protein
MRLITMLLLTFFSLFADDTLYDDTKPFMVTGSEKYLRNFHINSR